MTGSDVAVYAAAGAVTSERGSTTDDDSGVDGWRRSPLFSAKRQHTPSPWSAAMRDITANGRHISRNSSAVTNNRSAAPS